MVDSESKRINCYKCVHFAVSWDPKFPRSCRFFGFKTSKMPSVRVFESSGEPCEGFQAKTVVRKDRRRGWEA